MLDPDPFIFLDGSEDPDSYKHEMDPKHCIFETFKKYIFKFYLEFELEKFADLILKLLLILLTEELVEIQDHP